MVSMKLFVASSVAVAKACGGCSHVHTPTVAQDVADTIAVEQREMELTTTTSTNVDDSYFTSRGHYGSSWTEAQEAEYSGDFERKEVDCALLKGNQTLPSECGVFANTTESVFVKIDSTNSTSVDDDECDHLTGMARIKCLGLKTQPIDCSKFKGSSTMPYECAVQFGMVDDDKVETIVLEEAQAGDELTWDQAFQTMFPDLMTKNESDDSCFSCGILSSLFPADSVVGKMASKAANLVKAVFDEPELPTDDIEFDCAMQLGNKTMTAECSEALDSEFEYYRGENSTNSTVANEPKISPLGFIVEEIDCERLARTGQTLPWECYQKMMNQTKTESSWFN